MKEENTVTLYSLSMKIDIGRFAPYEVMPQAYSVGLQSHAHKGQTMPIEFYRERDLPYGCFSNFSKHSFTLGSKPWQTVEHYFQAQKFPGTPQEHAIQIAPDPMTAKRLGNSREYPLRPDWEAVKDTVMRDAVRAKFTQHEDIRAILLGTGGELLIEAALNDSYWGSGPDGKGHNKLGLTLMEVRDELR